jgi:hypothetical protein
LPSLNVITILEVGSLNAFSIDFGSIPTTQVGHPAQWRIAFDHEVNARYVSIVFGQSKMGALCATDNERPV